MLQISRCASIGGIERFVAAILLAVAVAGAVAFPRLLGRIERVPTPGFDTHPPSATTVEAAPFPSAPAAARPTVRTPASPSGRVVLRRTATQPRPVRTPRPKTKPVTRPVRPPPGPSTPVTVTAPAPAPVSTPAPTPTPVVVAAPAPVVKLPVAPVAGVPPGKVVVPVPTPVPLPVNPLPDRPPEGQPIVVQQQRLLLTVTPPATPGDAQPVVTPPSVGIPAPIAPSPLDDGSDSG